MAIQEAVPVVDNAHLFRLFGQEVLGQLPVTGHDRVRLTAVGLLGWPLSLHILSALFQLLPQGSTRPGLRRFLLIHLAQPAPLRS